MEILRRAARVAAAKLKDSVEAARIYQRLHSVDPTDSEALDALERHYERTRDWEKLVGILTTRLSLTAGGDEAIALYLRIAQMCEEGLRDADRAIEHYRKILDIAPSHKEAIEALGRIYESTEHWAEFIDVTRRQIRIVTDRAQKALLYFKCGSVMEAKFGNEHDAIRYYDAAIKTSPSCLPAVHGLRDLYRATRNGRASSRRSSSRSSSGPTTRSAPACSRTSARSTASSSATPSARCSITSRRSPSIASVCRRTSALFEHYFARGECQRALPIAVILAQKVDARRRSDRAQRVLSQARRRRRARPAISRAAAESLVVALEIKPRTPTRSTMLVALAAQRPTRRTSTARTASSRSSTGSATPRTSLARVLVGAAIVCASARTRSRRPSSSTWRRSSSRPTTSRPRRAGVAARAAAALDAGGGRARGVHRARQVDARRSSRRAIGRRRSTATARWIRRARRSRSRS